MLHFLRRRLAQIAEGEAAGQSFWQSGFPPEVRGRLIRLQARLAEGRAVEVLVGAREILLDQMGQGRLTDKGAGDYGRDMLAFMTEGPDDMVPSWIEALIQAFRALDQQRRYSGFDYRPLTVEFIAGANEILQQGRVAWTIESGEMIPFESKELHTSVVQPTLKLLHASQFALAEQAYRKALEELSGGDPSDAITDAGTALQEALTALGWKGNSLGSQLSEAKKAGRLAAHDFPLVEMVSKTIDWASADRSEMGEAHKVTNALRDDAWLTVHIIGALIVRLASGSKR